MKQLVLQILFICAAATIPPAFATTSDEPDATPVLNQDHAVAVTPALEPDSRQMEKDLQQLPWKQARSIIQSVPKLKASVDAYGPLGWQFVEANYRQYGWKKKIDKLDATQKGQLAELIRKAQNAR